MALHKHQNAVQEYKNEVAIRFQLYNGLFTALPFHKIERTGNLLSVLLLHCEEGFQQQMNPTEIINRFFQQHTTTRTEKDKHDMLFRFIQYAERQVVLFDALEDAAFSKIKDITGPGTLKHTLEEVLQKNTAEIFLKNLSELSVSPVLTAHPTQFYPGSVLGIINDISTAVKQNNPLKINSYLQQLGKTPFLNQKKPTPNDEAVNLIWFLENVFYTAVGNICFYLLSVFPGLEFRKNPVVKMGFWPGGDRDGNPNVSADTSILVARSLRQSILKCYYLDVRKMRRRLTFRGVESELMALEKKLYHLVFLENCTDVLSDEAMLQSLQKMKQILEKEHGGLFVETLDQLMVKVQVFGMHFATLDIRQDSSIHEMVLQNIAVKENIWNKKYKQLNESERMKILQGKPKKLDPQNHQGMVRETLLSMTAIKTIQVENGERGCHRYIISHCTRASQVMEVFVLLRMSGWQTQALSVDIVPLFETIEDLENAGKVMETLYQHKPYREHLQRRGRKQTIMLGFSDGTKDGGYLMANWNIYKAKMNLSRISKEQGIQVVFFDGRGGPPARGGGKTHQFYASMGNKIENKEIQLTIQGQTISSTFGTPEAAKYNIEQLLSAGIDNGISDKPENVLNAKQENLLQELAEISYKKYHSLKSDPEFLPYLEKVSPLQYYAETNIGSRPAKRGTGKLSLDSLRAIPFVGAWSQIRQNITGYYGLGTALEEFEKLGKLNELKNLFKQSLFFRTLIENSEMSMRKCFFPLTAYLSGDEKFRGIYNQVFSEYERTEKYVLKLTGEKQLMANYPVEEISIQMRNRIVLPLHTIQQYAIMQMNGSKNQSPETTALYKKLIIRSSFGIINAARNSV